MSSSQSMPRLSGHKYVDTGYTLDTLVPGTATNVEGYGETGIAVFRALDGRVFALSNKCCHGRGQLHLGDIEEVHDKCENGRTHGGGRKPGACVACPKHRKKFPGGLLFSLDEGNAFTRTETPHYNPAFRVATYPVAVEEGTILVSTTPHADHPALSRGDKVNLLIGKAKRNILGRLTRTQNTHAEQVWREWKISRIEQVTHNTYIYTFTGPKPEKKDTKTLRRQEKTALWHLTLRIGKIDRDYTPISSLDDFMNGRARILIKLYDDGALTSRLAKLKRGGHVDCGGRPDLTLSLSPRQKPMKHVRHFGLIGGGTGVTPVLQALRLVVANPKWSASCIISVQTIADMILHDELASCIHDGKGRVKVHVCLTQHDVDSDGALRGKMDIHSIKGDAAYSSSEASDDDSEASSSGSDSNSSVDSDDDESGDSGVGSDASSSELSVASGDDGTQSGSGTLRATVGVSTRRIDKRLLKKLIPVSSSKPTAIVVSGPDGMWQDVRTMLLELGHDLALAFGLEA